MSEVSGGGASNLPPVTSQMAGAADNTTIYETSTYRPSDAFAPGFYEALGRVTVAFGRLDYVMMLVLKALRRTLEARAGQPRREFDELLAQDYQKPFADKCELATMLFNNVATDAASFGDPVIEEGAVEAFGKAVTMAKEIRDPGRNDNVHSYWTATTSDGTPMRIRPKPKAGMIDWNRSAHIQVAELLAIATKIEALANELGRITARLSPNTLR